MYGKEVVQKLEQEVRKKGTRFAYIEVGELSGMDVKELDILLKDNVNWEFALVSREAKVKCSCGFEGRPKILERSPEGVLFECPECGDLPEVISGKNIILK